MNFEKVDIALSFRVKTDLKDGLNTIHLGTYSIPISKELFAYAFAHNNSVKKINEQIEEDYKKLLEKKQYDAEIYCDGGITCNPNGIARWGIIVKAGDDIYSFKGKIDGGGLSCNVSEWVAVHQAFKWLLKNKTKSAKILGDSQMIIRQCQGKYKISKHKIYSPFAMQAIKDLNELRKFCNVCFEWIPRELNSEADALTH